MIYKKILIIFLLILCIFSFSSVHAENIENINVTSSSVEHMKADIDFFKQVLKNNNINNMNDLKSFFGITSVDYIQYFYIEDAGQTNYNYQYVAFYTNFERIFTSSNNYKYYGVQQNTFNFYYYCDLRYTVDGGNHLEKLNVSPDNSTIAFTAPFCWFGVKTADLFTKDSSQIVANAVENVDNSINNLNDKLTEDNSSQADINLNSHNGEMNNASDSIKNSNLYSKFTNLSNDLQEAFTYNDNDVTTLPISFGGKNVVLKSNEISKFFGDNNLGFVITLWQSILWFSLFYTMFIFIRKLYKSVTGGNPVDDVQNTLSSEDNKMVGGF